MFGFGNDEDKAIFAVLIDISSGSIGTSIVSVSPVSKLPTILYSNRINTRISEHSTSTADNLRRIREALFSASLTFSQEGFPLLQTQERGAKISHMFVTCSAPWAHTLAQHVEYENDIRFKISDSILEDLVQSAITDISSKFQNNEFTTKEGFESVDQTTTDIRINDYSVSHPVGLSGTKVSLSHTAGLVPREIISGVHEIQDKLFRNTELSIHTYMLVFSTVLHRLFKSVEKMCIINMTNESIEFGILDNNLLIKNSAIPEGINSFILEIMQSTGKPQTDVESLMHAYTEKSHTETPELEKQIEIHSEKIAQALKKIHEQYALPHEVFITIQNPYEVLFAEVISRAFKKVTHKKNAIILIDQNLSNQISEGKNTDIQLSIGAQFFHTLHTNAEAERN